MLLPADLPLPAVGGFTTRTGTGSGADFGASQPPYNAANLALHVGDDSDAVGRNRAALAAEFELGPGDLAFGEQVHGPGVAVVERGGLVPGVDALVTRVPGVALVMMAADCLPVLLADPAARVVGAAHAGRAGLAGGVLQATLRTMAGLGARPEQTVASLGPAVCGRCYELPAAVADEVERAVPGSRATTRWGAAGVDLADGAERLLRVAGVPVVSRVGGCTLEQPDVFYSYRGSGVTGRHAGVVRLLP